MSLENCMREALEPVPVSQVWGVKQDAWKGHEGIALLMQITLSGTRKKAGSAVKWLILTDQNPFVGVALLLPYSEGDSCAVSQSSHTFSCSLSKRSSTEDISFQVELLWRTSAEEVGEQWLNPTFLTPFPSQCGGGVGCAHGPRAQVRSLQLGCLGDFGFKYGSWCALCVGKS